MATFFLFFPEPGSNLCRAGNGVVAFLFSSERRWDVARGGRRFNNVPLSCLPDRRRKEWHGAEAAPPWFHRRSTALCMDVVGVFRMKVTVDKSVLCKRYAGFTVALLVCALGVALVTNACLGTSPITSLPYALSAIFSLSLGTVTFLANICFLVVQKALLGRYFTVGHLMQIPAVFLFGLFIDGWMWATSHLVTDVYWQQMLMCLVGSIVLGMGVSLEIISNATVLPGEGMVVAIVFRTHKNFGNIKVLVDFSMVLAAALLSLAVLHTVVGLREGTIISAVLVGMSVRFFSRWTRRLAPLFWEKGRLEKARRRRLVLQKNHAS